MDILNFGIIAFFIIGFTSIGLHMFLPTYFREDNIIEEVAEEILKKETGIDIDITPNSPEKDKNEKSSS